MLILVLPSCPKSAAVASFQPSKQLPRVTWSSLYKQLVGSPTCGAALFRRVLALIPCAADWSLLWDAKTEIVGNRK